MSMRGVRGATTVAVDAGPEILAATRELLAEMLRANDICDFEEIASIFFTTTPDLVATFPAEAAREMGMHLVPLLCASEIAVPGRMPRCVRVLIHWNTSKPQPAITHVYLRDAKRLRPDVEGAQ